MSKGPNYYVATFLTTIAIVTVAGTIVLRVTAQTDVSTTIPLSVEPADASIGYHAGYGVSQKKPMLIPGETGQSMHEGNTERWKKTEERIQSVRNACEELRKQSEALEQKNLTRAEYIHRKTEIEKKLAECPERIHSAVLEDCGDILEAVRKLTRDFWNQENRSKFEYRKKLRELGDKLAECTGDRLMVPGEIRKIIREVFKGEGEKRKERTRPIEEACEELRKQSEALEQKNLTMAEYIHRKTEIEKKLAECREKLDNELKKGYTLHIPEKTEREPPWAAKAESYLGGRNVRPDIISFPGGPSLPSPATDGTCDDIREAIQKMQRDWWTRSLSPDEYRKKWQELREKLADCLGDRLSAPGVARQLMNEVDKEERKKLEERIQSVRDVCEELGKQSEALEQKNLTRAEYIHRKTEIEKKLAECRKELAGEMEKSPYYSPEKTQPEPPDAAKAEAYRAGRNIRPALFSFPGDPTLSPPATDGGGFTIASVTGYSPDDENWPLAIAVKDADGTWATPEEGFNVQVYVAVPKWKTLSSGNAEFFDAVWRFTVTAPEREGSYRLSVYAYCGLENSTCEKLYGRARQVTWNLDFIVGTPLPSKPPITHPITTSPVPPVTTLSPRCQELNDALRILKEQYLGGEISKEDFTLKSESYQSARSSECAASIPVTSPTQKESSHCEELNNALRDLKLRYQSGKITVDELHEMAKPYQDELPPACPPAAEGERG